MTCDHFWLPKQGTLSRSVWCGRCGELRRVGWRWAGTEPRTTADALAEAIDRNVIANEEVVWGGQRLR
jgi:hypothetical protein